LNLWNDRFEANSAGIDELTERLEKARQRVLRGKTDNELNEKIKQLEAELTAGRRKFNIEFRET
jgi:ribosomal protein L29